MDGSIRRLDKAACCCAGIDVRNLRIAAPTPPVANGSDATVDHPAVIEFAASQPTPRLEPSVREAAVTGPRRGSRRQAKTPARLSVPALTAAELVQLRSRVIALENLVITLLAEVAPHQLERARAMAQYISPRAGATPHPLTLHAAAQMVQLVDRADHFRQAEI
jgi:hypothetical protein